MPNILPTTPNQNLIDLKNTINRFSNQWGKFINTKVGRKIDRFFNGPTEEDYNKMGFNKPKTDIGIAGLVVPKIGLPIKSRSLLDGTNSEAQFSVDNWSQAIRAGITKAREFLNSETKARTFERNNRLFKSIYKTDLPKSNFDINTPVQIKTVSLKDWNPGNFDYKADVINLNSNLIGSDYAAFHEYLHRNRYADALDPVFFSNTPRKVRFDADDFYSNVAIKTLNKDYFKIDPQKYEYLMNANELGANALELGVREGLTFGQKYPGVLEANKVFERLEQNPSKGFVMQAIDWKNQPRRAWRAITGTLFGTTPFIFIQNQDQNKNESNIQ